MDVVRVREDRPLRIRADHEEVGLFLPEVARGAGDRAAGADGDDEGVDLAIRLLQSSGPVVLVVRLGVGGVGILVGLERARDLLCEPVRDGVVALLATRAGRRSGR
jgi:hypothetical protein